MFSTARSYVRAVLPALPLALCLGCGAHAPSVTTETPAAPAPQKKETIAVSVDSLRDAEIGARFELLPTAHAGAGVALKYSAENLPPWARIDADTGRITGTPGAHDIGAYEAVTIIASDALTAARTAPFTITVLGEMPTDMRVVATVRWETPPVKLDGSPLDDLAGYRILYGRNAEDLDQSVLVMNPRATSYDFSALGTGIWYFAIVAVNANGLEGPATLPAMKSI